MIIRKLSRLLKTEAGPGIILFGVLVLAILIANSPFANIYDSLRELPIQIRIGQINIYKPLLLWINEGLMAIFFFDITLEMKYEVMRGELKTWSHAALPFIAAIGGIVLPALIYILCTFKNAEVLKGWPIPTTTDIAFSLGALVIMGKRVPSSLRSFLIALSIVDDIVAIALIALVYTDNLSLVSGGLAILGILLLIFLHRMKVKSVAPFVVVGVGIWVCLLKSGVHATLAGVIVALATPITNKLDHEEPSYHHLRKTLEPWVNHLILPLFVFCNGGLSLEEFSFSNLIEPVALGIILGLWLGKLLGIYFVATALIKFKIVHRPRESTPLQLLGVSAFAGIGFTMSLFLGSLAFNLTDYEEITRQSVLIGSFLSLITGILIFRCAEKINEN